MFLSHSELFFLRIFTNREKKVNEAQQSSPLNRHFFLQETIFA